MNFENVSSALMLVFDTLREDDDQDSIEIIEMIDTAPGDFAIKEGLKRAVVRLDVVNPEVANKVRELAKGFAF